MQCWDHEVFSHRRIIVRICTCKACVRQRSALGCFQKTGSFQTQRLAYSLTKQSQGSKYMQMSCPDVLVVCGPRWLITNWKLSTMKAWDLRPLPSSPWSIMGTAIVRSASWRWWKTGCVGSNSLYEAQNHPNNCRHETSSSNAKPPNMILG